MMEERTNLKFSDIANDINSQAGRTIVDVNNPTYEGQQAVQEWLQQHPGYEPGSVTNGYLSTPTEPPQEKQPQLQEPNLEFTNNPTGAQNIEFNKSPLDIWNPFGAQQDPNVGLQNKIQAASTNGAIDPTKMSDQLAADQRRQELDTQTAQQVQADKEAFDAKQARKQARRQDFRDITSGVGNTLAAWNPVVTGALGGVDRSGEAAGYAAQAAQNQYNAAQNEKLRQANMQQAMDNTIADKMAAAEAESKWKQNARALREGGAQAVAAQNEAATPDLWKQKQLQNERRDVAAQNLAEVNRNKLMAIGNETSEAMTNYATNVEDSQNAYKAALANAKNAENADKAKNDAKSKSETSDDDKVNETSIMSTDTTERTEDNSNNTDTESTETQPEGTTSVAPSNQESEGAETVTDQMKAQQIHDRIEAIYKDVESAAKNKDAEKLNSLAAEYDQLVNDFKALPTEVQQIGYRQFDPRHMELNAENVNYDYKNLIDAINDRTL